MQKNFLVWNLDWNSAKSPDVDADSTNPDIKDALKVLSGQIFNF
jgi:hypothetical protein